MSWGELIAGTQETVEVEGRTVVLRSCPAGVLADAIEDTKPNPFRIMAGTVVDPPMTEEEARNLPPMFFAKLWKHCEKVNGTDEELE